PILRRPFFSDRFAGQSTAVKIPKQAIQIKRGPEIEPAPRSRTLQVAATQVITGRCDLNHVASGCQTQYPNHSVKDGPHSSGKPAFTRCEFVCRCRDADICASAQ